MTEYKFKIGDEVKYINTDVKLVFNYPIEKGIITNITINKLGNIVYQVRKQNTFYEHFSENDLIDINVDTPIFDADGWCWKMDLLKADGSNVLLFHRDHGFSIGHRTDVGIYGDYDIINLCDKFPKKEWINKIIEGYVVDWEAWKPFNYPTKHTQVRKDKL